MADKKIEKLISNELSKLFSFIGVETKVSSEKKGDYFHVTLDSSDNALLIGRYGDTLSAFEHILALLVANRYGEHVPLTLEIGGYRSEREGYLEDLAARVRDEVVATGREKVLSDLKPWERRVIHMYLSEDGSVESESMGEGRSRVLTIRRK